MPRSFWRFGAPLLLSLLLAALARADSLTSLKLEPISSAESAVAPAPLLPADLPALTGPAAGLTPVAGLRQNDALWLLARDAEGREHWLSYSRDTGWKTASTPPAVINATLIAAGQAHVLAVSPTPTGDVTVYTFHTITNTWARLGEVKTDGPLTAVRALGESFILTSRTADGATHDSRLSIVLTKRLLTATDWIIIVVYLAFSAGIGLYYYLQEKKQSNEDFFLGGRRIPWWAAGVSLYATGTSAISFIAIPAKSFATNWLYLAANVIGLVGNVFVAIWIVPLIRRLNLMSVYHYLEMRFHPKIRVIASAIAILIQLGGRMSIVLYLPSLAISAVTGLSVMYSIMIMGVVTIVYTVMGGMKAVIWTDFLQVIVMLGGAFFAVGYIIQHVPGGFGEFIHTAVADGKLRTFDWSFDLTKATVWGFLLLTILGIITYPQDQVMMQRVLSTKSDKEAGWSVWMLAAIVVPGSVTFFAIGTALYVFYKNHPDRLNPMMSIDSTFPQFIAAELPVGVTGFIIAGIFAASMSTLASCINSVATLVSVDFYERYAKNPTQAKSVKLAEWATVIAGFIGVGTALLLASFPIKSALDVSFELAGLLGGGFAGCYGLGLFSKRANWQGAVVGVAASFVITFVAWIFNLVHPYFYLPLATLSCIVVGYVGSYFFPAPQQSLEGLTVYTPRKTPVALGAS